jgi:hypothetical protein
MNETSIPRSYFEHPVRLFLSTARLRRWFFFLGALIIIGLAGCAAGSTIVKTNLGPNFNKAAIVEEPVAVVPDKPSKEGDFFADLVANELLGVGFRVIERVRLETMLREHQLSLTGLLEKQDYIQLGKLASIRRLFIISALFSPKKGMVADANIKLVDLNTGEVLMGTIYKNFSPDDPNHPRNHSLPKSSKVIADSIAEQIGRGGSRP